MMEDTTKRENIKSVVIWKNFMCLEGFTKHLQKRLPNASISVGDDEFVIVNGIPGPQLPPDNVVCRLWREFLGDEIVE